jgi:hypothetical protein
MEDLIIEKKDKNEVLWSLDLIKAIDKELKEI